MIENNIYIIYNTFTKQFYVDFFHLILTSNPVICSSYNLHFLDNETEPQRVKWLTLSGQRDLAFRNSGFHIFLPSIPLLVSQISELLQISLAIIQNKVVTNFIMYNSQRLVMFYSFLIYRILSFLCNILFLKTQQLKWLFKAQGFLIYLI